MPIAPVVAERVEEIREICREYGVKRPDLFGSATTGEFDEPTSDVDFLVTFHKGVCCGWMGKCLTYGMLWKICLTGRWTWCRTVSSAIPTGMRSKKAECRSMPTRTTRYLWDVQEAATAVTRFTEHRQVIGFRNVLVHGYDDVGYENVWGIVTTKQPILVEEVRGLLESSTTQ